MRKQKGFTLVELVVVVMILGILAAVATPRLLGTSAAASDNGLRQTLAIVRDAIERHAAENGGALPAQGSTDEATFKADLTPYLRGPFPTCPVSSEDDSVSIVTDGTALSGDASPTESWKYDSTTGEFIVNSQANTNSDATIAYDEL